MPLVPVVIQGAHHVMGKGHWLPNWDRWSRTLTVTYLKLIPTQNVPIENRGILQEQAFQEMNAVLQPPGALQN
jgi:hypothetical protein